MVPCLVVLDDAAHAAISGHRLGRLGAQGDELVAEICECT